MSWDPQLYLRFGDERAQPFHDLLARVQRVVTDPAEVGLVVDLGCGPGSLTATLGERFGAAQIVGVDASAEMIADAAARSGARLRFELGDASTWQPPGPVDVLISNAALQWIDDHVGLLERWLDLVRPGGVFGFQVPGNFNAPSHRSFAEQVASPRWRDRIDPAVLHRPRSAEPEIYLARLLDLGAAVQVWESTYYHVLQGEDPVLNWIRGTGLRPVLDALEPADVPDFEAELGARLRELYPRDEHGTVLAFRRLFAVAVRDAGPQRIGRPAGDESHHARA